ncbi:MAG: NHL repeat-containing protein, partial [Candidatus Riflebacteria bacterium]|nr:NHL repeat-containing protein [Candidatus Riflebacteria bacterium]
QDGAFSDCIGITSIIVEKGNKTYDSRNDCNAIIETASGTCVFTINLPIDGCLAIITEINGRNKTERLWGPRFMKKGTYRLSFPEKKLTNKKGSIELYNIKLTPFKETGSKGKGERQFDNPTGIDYDVARKEILIADSGNDRIIRLGKDGRFIGKHGGFGLSYTGSKKSDEGEDSLNSPYDVAAGGFSNFYISDYGNDRIAIYDSYKSYKGNLFPKKNDRRNRLNKPKGIVSDYENNIWVVDGRSDLVYKISPHSSKLLEIGGFGYSEKQLKNPTQVDVGIDGSVYVADRGKSRIAVFDRLGSYKYEIKDSLKSPTGVAVDSDGLLTVCDDNLNELSLYTPQGIRLSVISEATNGSSFKKPSDIALCDDTIFLLDSGNHIIIHIKREKEGYVVSWQGPSTVLE